MDLISLSNVSFGYNDNNLLDSVSFAFNDNEHIAIIGDNGSGKTTLLNVLSSFIGNEERIITIEDTRELNCTAPNKVALFTTDYVDMDSLLRKKY